MAEKQQPQSTITYLFNNKPHRVYPITYSHLDKEKFPTRESVWERLCNGFWRKQSFIFCLFQRKVGNAEHYHVAILISPS